MKAWEITKKDLRILLRDARALFVLLVLPLVFITIIGLTMGKILGWKNTNQVLRVGVVDAVAYEQIGQAGWDEETPETTPADAKAGNAVEAAKTPGDKPSESTSTATASPKEPVETLDAEEKIKQKKIARNIIVKVINELQARGGF